MVRFRDASNFMLDKTWGRPERLYLLKMFYEDSETVTAACGVDFFEKYDATALNTSCWYCSNIFQRSKILNGPNAITGPWKDPTQELEEQLIKSPLNMAIESVVKKFSEDPSPVQSGDVEDPGEPSTSADVEQEEELIQVEDWLLHSDLESLMLSAEARCHFCTQISLLLQRSDVQSWNGDSTNKEYRLRIAKIPKGNLKISLYRGPYCTDPSPIPQSAKVLRCRSVMGRLEELGDEEPDLAHCCLSTSSIAHVALANNWLNDCRQRHRNCVSKNTDKKPSRLLFVGGDGDKVSLWLNSGQPMNFEYCALSHCWGGVTDILTLRSTTVHALEQGVSTADLPTTFRDAVTITRNLGFAYIWIDSLCIIQDSEEDWIKEAEAMCDVYESAVVTIAAAGAKNSHSGCFIKRDPLRYLPCRIVANEFGCVYADYEEANFGFAEVTRDCAHDYRGWVFQEKVLSRRVLYFGQRGMYWSCSQGQATELNPKGWAWHRGKEDPQGAAVARIFQFEGESIGFGCQRSEDRQEHVNLKGLLESFNERPRTEFEMIFPSRWCSMVHHYSRLDLTKSEDKLPALSGIVQRIQRHTGFEYHAGLWRECLPAGLLWYVLGGQKQRLTFYRAPTWSWAAADGTIGDFLDSVFSPTRRQKRCTDVVMRVVEFNTIETKTHPLDKSGTGRVFDGTLKITGRIRKVECFKDMEGSDAKLGRCHIFTYEQECVGTFMPDISFTERPSDVYLVPCIIVYGKDPDGKPLCFANTLYKIVIGGLALVPKDEHFERIGIFVSPNEAEEPPALAWLRNCERKSITIK